MIFLEILHITLLGNDEFLYVCLIPKSVIEKFQYWRLISAVFFHNGIFHLVMNMMSFATLGVTFERTVGTTAFFLYILIFGIVSSLISVLVSWFMDFGGRHNEYYSPCVGFSGVLFSLMYIDCSLSGGEKRSVLGLFLVSTEFYPYAMLLILSLLLPNVSLLGHASGIVVGLLYQINILKWLKPPKSIVSLLEKCCCCAGFRGFFRSDHEELLPEPFTFFDGFNIHERINDEAMQYDGGGMDTSGNVWNNQRSDRSGSNNNSNNRNDNSGPFSGRPNRI